MRIEYYGVSRTSHARVCGGQRARAEGTETAFVRDRRSSVRSAVGDEDAPVAVEDVAAAAKAFSESRGDWQPAYDAEFECQDQRHKTRAVEAFDTGMLLESELTLDWMLLRKA